MRQRLNGKWRTPAGNGCGPRRPVQRGVALVMALLLLALVSTLALGMTLAVSSQTLIGGYYRNFRGAFYAADSGVNIARQQMVNQLEASVSAAFANPPIANAITAAPAIGASVQSAYSSSTSLNSGNAAQSWRGSFKLSSASLALDSSISPNPQPGPVDSNGNPTSFKYFFKYALTSVGAAQGSEQNTVQENGDIILYVTGVAANLNVSFAYFGGFVDQYPACLGPLVPGTMTGPMFTNNGWEFMPPMGAWTAPYVFTDPVGQAWADAYYYDTGWGCHASPTTSYGSGANLVAPTFQEGFQLNQPTIALPGNSFSQEWAVLDGKGCGEGSNVCGSPTSPAPPTPTTANLSVLQNASGLNFSSSTTSGVFFKGSCSGSGAATTCALAPGAGGFYVQGDASVLLQPVGSTAEQYTITQGSTTTMIVINPTANTTVVNGVTYTGVPESYVTNAGGSPATMVYVNGNVTSLSGTGEGQPAIQDNTAITLTASGNITATGDVLYKTEPVTYTQNQIIPGSSPACCNGTPMDYLIPSAANMTQVLGIFTPTGNFTVQSSYADSNIQVDGSIATISQQASSSSGCNSGSGNMGGFTANGYVNTFNNVGGQIQSCIFYADISTENIWFDRRYTQTPGFAPPWFPSTTITQGGPLPSNTQATVSRMQWVNTSAY